MSSDQSGEPPLLQEEEADPGPKTGGKDEAPLGSEGGSGGMVSEAFFSLLAYWLSDCRFLTGRPVSTVRPLCVISFVIYYTSKINSNKIKNETLSAFVNVCEFLRDCFVTM